MKKKVVIVGFGALGKCFAAFLQDQADVTVFHSKSDHFILKEGQRRQKVRTRVVSSLKELESEKVDVLILATKVMDLRVASAAAAKLHPRCVFFPQNGLFPTGWIQKTFRGSTICRGVATLACQESGAGSVQLLHRGQIYVDRKGTAVASLFRKAGLKVSISGNSDGFILSKLIFNAVMNPLPVITGKGYHILKTNHTIFKLAYMGIREGMAVAKALNIRLAFDPMKFFLRVADGDLAGLPYKGSMFQDVAMRQKTEIDWITGALIRIARQKSVPVPALKSIFKQAKALGA
jgi:2-dehydropantoate 2-reductase